MILNHIIVLFLFSSKTEMGFRNMRNIGDPCFKSKHDPEPDRKLVNVESVDRNTFCWTIITSTNVPIIIIMCQVNVFILPKGEIFVGILECS